MKLKWIILILSAILIVILLVIDKQSAQDSGTDKWTSFGLGVLSVVFVESIMALIAKNRKKKAI